MWKPSQPMSLSDFVNGPGCVTLFEELPGNSAISVSGTGVKRKKSHTTGKKTKKTIKPAKRVLDNPSLDDVDANNDSEDHNTTAASSEQRDEAPPPRKKKRKRRATQPAVVSSSHPGAAEGVLVDPAEVLASSGTDVSSWESLHVSPPLLAALAQLGYEQPTEIQRRCLPAAIRGRMDVVGAAETGSGKTLAFALPLLYGIMKGNEAQKNGEEAGEMNSDEDGVEEDAVTEHSEQGPKALVLAPTRELAIQVKNHIVAVAKYTGVKVVSVVGGMSEQKQQRLLARRPEVVVATPGRLWEFIEARDPYLSNLAHLRFLVVDETDRMLEKGHFQQLHLLLELINSDKELSERRQNFVFSATLTMDAAPAGRDVKHLKTLSTEQKLQHITAMVGIRQNSRKVVDLTRKAGTAEKLTEMAISCSIAEKDELLYYFCLQHRGRTLVFCNSIDCVTRVGRVFALLQMSPLLLHANMQQRQRLKNLQRFQTAPAALLVATDVAARGLDVPGVQHVVHYQVPRTTDAYVHRSGRTARAGTEGLSVMLVEPGEVAGYRKLLKQLSRESDLPPFHVEAELLRPLAAHVQLARTINLAEFRQRRDQGARSWHERAAEQMDMELDSTLTPERDEEADRRTNNEIKARRLQLRDMLASRSDIWAPRTQHGRLKVPDRNVSALELAKKTKKKTKDGKPISENQTSVPEKKPVITPSSIVEESADATVAPPADSGHSQKQTQKTRKKMKLAAASIPASDEGSSKRRKNAKQRRKKKWFARKANGGAR